MAMVMECDFRCEVADWRRSMEIAYQCAGGVDARVADSGVIEPFWLGEAEESVAWDVHGGLGG